MRFSSTVRAAPRLLAAAAALALVAALPASASAAAESGSISGKVTEAAKPHKAIEGIEVCVFPQAEQSAEEEESSEGRDCTKTGSGGEYTFSSLEDGSYVVGFGDPFPTTLNFVTQYYDGKASFNEAGSVTVSGKAATTAIDAEMQEGAEISGTITKASNGAPAGGESGACAFLANATPAGEPQCAKVGPGGSYTISGLPAGTYKLLFIVEEGNEFGFEYYNGASNAMEAGTLVLAAQEDRKEINASVTIGAPTIDKLTPLGPGTESAPGTSTGSGTLPGALGMATAPLSLASTRLAVNANGVARVKLECSKLAACRGKLALTEKRTIKHGSVAVTQTIVIAGVQFALRAGEKATVKLKLGPTGRALLSAAHGQLLAHLALVQQAPTPGTVSVKHVVLVEARSAPAKG